MKPVFQTVVDKGKGNCMQAACASLLELPLDEVPNFIEFDGITGTNAHFEMRKFLVSKGYEYSVINPNRYRDGKVIPATNEELAFTLKCLKFDGGINGYFYATVPSQTFENTYHAVIIDSDMNIVHDPNPNQRALSLTKHDIVDITTNRGDWHISAKGIIVDEKNC